VSIGMRSTMFCYYFYCLIRHPFLLYPHFIDRWKKRFNRHAENILEDSELDVIFDELDGDEQYKTTTNTSNVDKQVLFHVNVQRCNYLRACITSPSLTNIFMAFLLTILIMKCNIDLLVMFDIVECHRRHQR
jgi:hypothetical protein